jgi:hypothetical protein
MPHVSLPSHPPTRACRRPGDEHLKPNQKLNVMLQRILRADFTFPPNKNLRCAPCCRCSRCCCRQLSYDGDAGWDPQLAPWLPALMAAPRPPC